jgi:hypothetical protein
MSLKIHHSSLTLAFLVNNIISSLRGAGKKREIKRTSSKIIAKRKSPGLAETMKIIRRSPTRTDCIIIIRRNFDM